MESNSKYNSLEQLEIFDRYLMQKMDVSDRDAFEEQLNNDFELNESFEEYRAMVVVVEENALKEKMEDFHFNLGFEKGKVVPLNKPRRFNYLVAASVALLLGLGGLWFFNFQNQSLFDEYFTPDPGLSTVMGNSDDYNFYEAMVDYKRKNYTDAIKKWELLLAQKPQNDTLNYFLGSAFLASDQEELSKTFLERVASNENSVFYSDANFYLGLVYLKMGQEDKVNYYLEKSNSKAAKELISKVNKKD